ncbi:MAG TPA: hypothetical protein VIQ76_05115, partial [Propionibacteriaceae bacterium]
MTRVRAVTAVLTGLTVLAVVAGIVTAVKLPTGSWLVWFLLAVLIGAINAGLAVFVAWKAADNWCAVVLALAGCWMCASATSDVSQAGFSTGSAPPSPWVIALTQGTWMLYYLPLAWLMLIFPTGRVLTSRWRA